MTPVNLRGIAVVVVMLFLTACTSSTSPPRPSTTLTTVRSPSTSTTATSVPVTVSSTPPSVPVVAVKFRLVAKGQFSGLVSSRRWLYAVEPAQHGPQLAKTTVVRVDPTSGRIVARSAILPGAVELTFTGNTLWLMAGLTKDRGLPTGLVELDPTTLRQERFVPENSLDSLSGSAHGPLWAALGCKLVRLDPRSGRALHVVTVHGGTQCGTVTDSEGQHLYVEVGPESLRGQPPSPTLLLQERNARSGRLIGSAIIANPPNGGVWVAAYDGNVWTSGGDPGACGSISDYRTSPLRLFATSYGHECQDLPPGVHGGPGASLPNTDQFPLVDISGGVVWVTSAGGIDCFNPRTARFEAVGKTYVLNGPIVVMPTGTYGAGPGLERLTVPAQCRR